MAIEPATGDDHTAGRPLRRIRPIVLVLALLAGLATALTVEVILTRPVRRSVHAYHDLISAANRQDLDEAGRLCSDRYRREVGLRPAPEGGIAGLPRSIHKNFQAWRQGPNVWICPTNRVGPIFQFIPDGDGWKFDGLVGLLRPEGMEIYRDGDEAD